MSDVSWRDYMKLTQIIYPFIIFFFTGLSAIGQQVPPQSDYLTLNVVDEDLIDVLKMISLETGDSIVTEPIDFSTYKTTINVSNVHKHVVLKRILTPHDLRLRVVGDTIIISSRSASMLRHSIERLLIILSVSLVLGAGIVVGWKINGKYSVLLWISCIGIILLSLGLFLMMYFEINPRGFNLRIRKYGVIGIGTGLVFGFGALILHMEAMIKTIINKRCEPSA